ncbi:hypothetical protein ACODM8_20205 [Vibrio ostreicida]|uniref:Polysaccharide biosynthesis protein n=1 Tax=Vibrio ostreicida TaxID=526588 RepID=A0ABT8BYW3_9VIBR|nr:hypothetical protein [Vibrio ostreicida]MDN3611275.1 hypothetical protein [Vibrio ostreicida]MDN3612605.1 hypothetical protein [Vibrio ostreicida]NPD09220.1 hypothetical protein [Vibrio ostreicida]
MQHALNKIAVDTKKIAMAIFFVNVFAYGRGVFATAFATRLSTDAVIVLAYSMSIITIITMGVFGILSLIGMEISKAKDPLSYQQHVAKFFTVSVVLCVVVLIAMAVFMVIAQANHGQLCADFILVYAIGLMPFIFSTSLRYLLLAQSHTKIIKLTNVVTFVICVSFTLLFHSFFHLSIVSFALGCVVGFIYNLIHLGYFSVKHKVVTGAFLPHLNHCQPSEVVRFIVEGSKISAVYASDAVVSAFIILFTLSYADHYVVAIQVTLQLFLFASFWITGFSNGVMITLPKYRSVRQSKKAAQVVVHYIIKKAFSYFAVVALVLTLCARSILSSVFNLSGDAHHIATQEVYCLLILVFFDFIRQSLFYLLRLFDQVNSAVAVSYGFFFLSIISMAICRELGQSPIYFLLCYTLACLFISGSFLKKIHGYEFARR